VGSLEGRLVGLALGCIEWVGVTDGTDEGAFESVGAIDGTMDVEGRDEGILVGIRDIVGSEEGASEGSLDGIRETDGIRLGAMDTVGGEVSNTKFADDLSLSLIAFTAKGVEHAAATTINTKPPKNKRFRNKDDLGDCSLAMSFLSKLLFRVESVDVLRISLAISGSTISSPVTICQTFSNRFLASRSWRLNWCTRDFSSRDDPSTSTLSSSLLDELVPEVLSLSCRRGTT
jgi:hypothetical protein